jgi:hypothetical protein
MSNAKLYSSRNSMLISWLARELKSEIPELDIHGQERSLLDFAHHDLETYLRLKWKGVNSDDFDETLNGEDRQEEMKEFLKVWTTKWLEKWRERVTLYQKLPQFTLRHLEAKNKAKKIFKRMKKGEELKKIVEQKLINHGEVCMAELIAENLIIEQIACRLKMNKGKASDDKISLEPWSILQAVLPQVKRLIAKRNPLIHLKLMTDI